MKLFFSLLFSTCLLSATAQNSLNETLKQQLIKDWERAKAYTQEYLEVMPADKYSFRPIDSVRSFAEQMLHFAISNAVLVSIGTGMRTDAIQPFLSPDFGKSPTAQNKDSVLYYVNTSYDFAIAAIKNLDFNKLSEVVIFTLPGRQAHSNANSLVVKSIRTPDTSPWAMHCVYPALGYSTTG